MFDINVFMKELVSQIPAYNAFHTADVYMSSFIDHLCDMSVEAIQEILRIYNRNSQCTNRGRHATDIATVNKYLEDQCSADDE